MEVILEPSIEPTFAAHKRLELDSLARIATEGKALENSAICY